MNCKDCIHKPMCKYTEEFSNAEKKATDTLNEITKALPFKVTSSLAFDCTMYQGEVKEAPAPVAEKAPVKRHRRTKAEIAAANAKAIPSNESEDKIEAANKVIDEKIAEVKAKSKKEAKPEETSEKKETKPAKEITSEEQSVKEAIEKFVDSNEKKVEEAPAPVPTPEETFSEIKVEKEEKKTSSVEVDNEKKQNFLDLELEKILDAAIPTDVKKEIVNAKINLVRDCYNTELTNGLSKEAIEWINKGLGLFNMDTI